MARHPVYNLAIGGTLCLYLEAVEGDPTIVFPFAAKIKPVASASADVPPETLDCIGEAIVTAQPVSPGMNIDGTPIQPGFQVTISADVSSMMDPGFYIMDVGFMVAGNLFCTTPVVINATNSVSLS